MISAGRLGGLMLRISRHFRRRKEIIVLAQVELRMMGMILIRLGLMVLVETVVRTQEVAQESSVVGQVFLVGD